MSLKFLIFVNILVAALQWHQTRRQICCTVLNFHCLCRYTHELLFLLRIPAHASSAFAFCPHTFPIVTALSKCSLLTNIRKITSCLFTSSSARLIDITLKSVLLSWYAAFATVNNADVKFTRYKTWSCLCSSAISSITQSNVVIIQHNLAIICRYEWEIAT